MHINPKTLTQLRQAKAFSRQELATHAGVDKKTVARIEGGRGDVREITAKQIATALGVEPEMLSREPSTPDTNSTARVNPKTLRRHRENRNLSQQMLAERAGIDKKTVARIESGKGEAREHTVRGLADALGVKPEELARDFPENTPPVHGHIRYPLRARTLLACDMAADRYGVRSDEIIDAAPMLFTLLAEMSLADRRSRTEEANRILETFLQAAPEHLNLTSWHSGELELDSINAQDLFGRNIPAIERSVHDENIFGNFLVRMAKDSDIDNDVIRYENVSICEWDEVPDIEILPEFLEHLTGGSDRAEYALSEGYVRLKQIPKHLCGDTEEDEAIRSQRVAWLEDKVPDTDWGVEYNAYLNAFTYTVSSSLQKESELKAQGGRNET